MTDSTALPSEVDLIVVGGGITGAGIFHMAATAGVRTLLVDAADFGAGTSSWSSKLVHGGLRYLKQGQWRLTRAAVRERDRLTAALPGLVDPLPFVMPLQAGVSPSRWTLQAGLWLYDRLAGVRRAGYWNAAQARDQVPVLSHPALRGAVHFVDAVTDDVRLVLRLIFDGVEAGGIAHNYTRAVPSLEGGRVVGVTLMDTETGAGAQVRAPMTVLATGRDADPAFGAPPLRPLRGSHLVFSPAQLPLRHAISWLHPEDGRPVFAFPWLGRVLCGTTDLDQAPDAPVRMSSAEGDYLLAALQSVFPSRAPRLCDAVACFSGVRPVVAGGHRNPSSESRESAIWSRPGLVGVTGGKLTTFRHAARDVLTLAAQQVPGLAPSPRAGRLMSASVVPSQQRLHARLGVLAAGRCLRDMPGEDHRQIADTPFTWAELRWSARNERVRHLDDLMLRRTRLGLLLPEGGREWMPEILARVSPELGWSADRAEAEIERYQRQWWRDHAPLVSA